MEIWVSGDNQEVRGCGESGDPTEVHHHTYRFGDPGASGIQERQGEVGAPAWWTMVIGRSMGTTQRGDQEELPGP